MTTQKPALTRHMRCTGCGKRRWYDGITTCQIGDRVIRPVPGEITSMQFFGHGQRTYTVKGDDGKRYENLPESKVDGDDKAFLDSLCQC